VGPDVGADTQALDMARYLVQRMAPTEPELFEEAAPVVVRTAEQDGPPGLPAPGSTVVEASGMLLTTIAYGVAREVLECLAKQAGQAAVGRITSWFRILRRRTSATRAAGSTTEGLAEARPDRATAPALSPGVLDEVCGLAQRRAQLLGLPPDRAELLAESVVGYLSTAPGYAG
jgi:hypothetical protein